MCFTQACSAGFLRNFKEAGCTFRWKIQLTRGSSTTFSTYRFFYYNVAYGQLKQNILYCHSVSTEHTEFLGLFTSLYSTHTHTATAKYWPFSKKCNPRFKCKSSKIYTKNLTRNEMKNANVSTETRTKVLSKIKSFGVFYYIQF
jgi:hypothetical protein